MVKLLATSHILHTALHNLLLFALLVLLLPMIRLCIILVVGNLSDFNFAYFVHAGVFILVFSCDICCKVWRHLFLL